MSTPIHVPNWRLNIERNRELTDELGCSPAAYLIGVNGCFDIEMSQPGQELTYLTQRQFTIVCDFTGEPKAEFKRDYSRARFLLRVARISEGKSIRYSEAIPTTKEEYIQFLGDFLKWCDPDEGASNDHANTECKVLDVATDILAWFEEARELHNRL